MAYLELHAVAPSRCRSPEAEAEHHRLTNTVEHRAGLRDQRLHVRFAALEQATSVQRDRWRTPPDLLDD